MYAVRAVEGDFGLLRLPEVALENPYGALGAKFQIVH